MCFLLFIFLSLSLSLSLFFRLIPWSIEAPCIHLSARVSKIWEGRRSASSLPRENGRAPVASVNRANFLSWSFIVNQGISASFSPLFSYLQHSYLSLSLNQSQSPTPFLLRVSPDPAGAGPRRSPSIFAVIPTVELNELSIFLNLGLHIVLPPILERTRLKFGSNSNFFF